MRLGARSVKHRCGRCGIDTSAEFCRDCQQVDPEMTAGGLNARQFYAKVRLPELRDELQHQEVLVALAPKEAYRRQAQRQVERLKGQISKLEERLAA